MANLLIHHRVKEFGSWKKAFDAHASTRKAAGCQGGQLFRSTDDPQDVVVLFSWNNADNARKFAQSEDLRTTMQKAGVIGPPTIVFLEDAEKVTR